MKKLLIALAATAAFATAFAKVTTQQGFEANTAGFVASDPDEDASTNKTYEAAEISSPSGEAAYPFDVAGYGTHFFDLDTGDATLWCTNSGDATYFDMYMQFNPSATAPDLDEGTKIAVFSPSLDGMTTATPMAALAEKALPAESLFDLFIGKIGGSLGEVSAAALLLGSVYLLVRKVISPRIPLAYLGTVAVLAVIFPRGGNDCFDWMLYELLSGGLMLGAIFMATDYATSPVTHLGQIVYGVGCGVLTILFRYFGAYVEGVTYAILIMNCCIGFFDKLGVPKRFGFVKPKKGGAEK